MENIKITELSNVSSTASSDLILLSTNTASSATSRSITVNDLQSNIEVPSTATTGDLLQYNGANWIATSASVDRGDPAAQDFTKDDLVIDSDWHNMDLSSIVPAGAVMVIMRLQIRHNTVTNLGVWVRKKGNSNNIAVYGVRNQVVGVTMEVMITAPIDSNRFLEYLVETETYHTINMTVAGWIF